MEKPVLKRLKRQASPTKFPSKRANTFVVAFAIHDPLDDTSKDAILKKCNSDKDAIYINPIPMEKSAASLKNFSSTAMTDLCPANIKTSVTEVKINILEDTERVPLKMADEHPVIIFDASNNMKKVKRSREFVKKIPKESKQRNTLNKSQFKYMNTIKGKARKKYSVRIKKNLTNFGEIQQMYSNNISKFVSRAQFVKKALAKENLLDGDDKDSIFHIFSSSEADGTSLNSSPSTVKKCLSYVSGSTLVNNSSSYLSSNDFSSTKTINSVGSVSSISTAYKTEIINVAVAVGFKSSKHDYQDNQLTCEEECNDKGNATSTDTITFTGMELTSQPPSEDSAGKIIRILNDINSNEKDQSNETLTESDRSTVKTSSNDDSNFVIAQTSSDFNKSNARNSEPEMTSNSETMMFFDEKYQENPQTIIKIDEFSTNYCKKNTLLNTVKNLGFYPEILASTSKENLYNISDIGITDKHKLNYTLSSKSSAATTVIENERPKNVLVKPFDDLNYSVPHKIIKIPHEGAIKSVLKNKDKPQEKPIKESGIPSDLSDIWERLTLILDLAVTKLENTLTEKIISEIKKSLSSFFQAKNKIMKPVSLTEIKTEERINNMKCEIQMQHKEVSVNQESFTIKTDRGFQCNLVQSQAIDQLMLKLSVEEPKLLTASEHSLKMLNKPVVIRDFVRNLPTVDREEAGKDVTVTVSTATAQAPLAKHRQSQWLKVLYHMPIFFVKENLTVIASVPSLLILIYCLYEVIMLLVTSH